MNPKKVTEKNKEHIKWYRDAKKQTMETLPKFLKHLLEDYKHDYGTICHAITAGMIATGHAIDHSKQGGISTFQGSCIMWEFIAEWEGLRGVPLRLVQYEDMLYPQYKHKFEKVITPDVWKYLRKEAQKLIKGRHIVVHPEVLNHWKLIAGGKVPFGYRVVKERL